MPLILNIDTAVQYASVCLADGESVISSLVSASDKESGGWLHSAIQDLLRQTAVSFPELEAIAVSAGPGSYTGLRVGMAAAKGLCYALSVPLIAVPTLQMMAASAPAGREELLCPMIDARRMEVFTAVYDAELKEIVPERNLILTEDSFTEWLSNNSMLFFGNGSDKAAALLNHPHAHFTQVETTAAHMVKLSAAMFAEQRFSDLAYSEPFYGKEFYSPTANKGKP